MFDYRRIVSTKIRMKRAVSPSAKPLVAKVTHPIHTDLETFFKAKCVKRNVINARAIPK
jgi:hypothetical protein